jgi:phage replication-related protein YjqB (UPF0714/DUF867 family)
MALNTASQVNIVPNIYVPIGTEALSPIQQREHCYVSADVATKLGIPVPSSGTGDLTEARQIRIEVTTPATPASTATFTVTRVVAGTNRVAIWENSDTGNTNGGIGKLFPGQSQIPSGAKARLRSFAPGSTTVDATTTTHFTEIGGSSQYFKEIVTKGSASLLLFAPHGGDIEQETSTQLATLKSELKELRPTFNPTVWDCQGDWNSGETYRRWHVHSDLISRSSFPGLDQIYKTYTRAVALHGFTWRDGSTELRGIVIGGRASLADKRIVQEEIVNVVGEDVISFHIADLGGNHENTEGPDGNLAESEDFVRPLRGLASANIVNRLAAGSAGIHIEQSGGVRLSATLRPQVAEGIAKALDRLLGTTAALEEQELVSVG